MELVVLVDGQNNEIGTAPKDTVHTKNTPLHRGFSLFLFNRKHELLLTRRAITKKTFPGVWTNTACGHPAPGETPVDAARRRLADELGISGVDIQELSPYQYRCADKNGIVENEICPVLIAFHDGNPVQNHEEVGEWKWMSWKQFLADINLHPEIYSPWCVEESRIIQEKL